MLDGETIAGVRGCVRRLRPRADQFRARFGIRLARISPAVAQRFERWAAGNGEMIEQALQSLAMGRVPDAALEELGPSASGVLGPDDLAPIGSALIGTSRELLGTEFTPEAEDACMSFYAYAAQQLERTL